MNIPFLDLTSQYKTINKEINQAIKRVLDRQFFVLGEELESFEKEFASYLDAKFVVGVNSGTDALALSLMALGVGKGDEVITQTNSFVASATAITQAGAVPVFVDCDRETYQIDCSDVEKKITKKTKAIMPVHLYGAPAPMDKILKIAKRNELFVVEDSAQGHGTRIGTKKTGTFGDLGAFSFYPGKNLGAYGDGGAISASNQEFYDELLKLRNHGQIKKYVHASFGVNSRLDEIQAAILRVKLRYLNGWNEKRNLIADKYRKGFGDFKTIRIIEHGYSCYHLFVIESEKREKLQKFLLDKGIHTLIHYPIPIHLQKAYKHLGYKIGDFPVAEKLSDRVLSLPVYPELDDSKIDYIIAALNSFNEHN